MWAFDKLAAGFRKNQAPLLTVHCIACMHVPSPCWLLFSFSHWMKASDVARAHQGRAAHCRAHLPYWQPRCHGRCAHSYHPPQQLGASCPSQVAMIPWLAQTRCLCASKPTCRVTTCKAPATLYVASLPCLVLHCSARHHLFMAPALCVACVCGHVCEHAGRRRWHVCKVCSACH